MWCWAAPIGAGQFPRERPSATAGARAGARTAQGRACPGCLRADPGAETARCGVGRLRSELDNFHVSGLPRQPGLAQARALLKAARAPAACERILARRRPDVVLGGSDRSWTIST